MGFVTPTITFRYSTRIGAPRTPSPLYFTMAGRSVPTTGMRRCFSSCRGVIASSHMIGAGMDDRNRLPKGTTSTAARRA